MRRLLIRPGAIGDVILALPALECLRARDTEIWAPSAVLPLLAPLGRAVPLASTGLDLLELGHAPPALLDRLRAFDSIVSWYGAAREEFRAALAGVCPGARLFPALPVVGDSGHAADFFLRQARALGACHSDGVPRLRVPRRDGGYAAIQPFSGGRAKNWPLERYRALARRLEQHLPVHFCAGPTEPLDGALRFAGLDELAAWLAGARLYIGNDSGITHLAAAVGTPAVALFGPTDPRLWAPRGAAVEIVHRAGPVANIPLEEVTAACERLLLKGRITPGSPRRAG
jgi:hypothetical protein